MNPQIMALRTKIIEKKQAGDTLYHTVKEAIAVGLLPMGTRLREEELAEAFETSRTPVREALKKLELERLIETSAGNGSVVRMLSVDECLDTMEVLELLRASACRMLLGRVPRALLMVLEQNIRKGTKVTDTSQRYENNAEFHDLLVRAAGNSVMANLAEQLAFTERMITNTILPTKYASDYAEHHRLLLKAIVENDEKNLETELQYSKEKVEEYMRRIVEAFLDAKG